MSRILNLLVVGLCLGTTVSALQFGSVTARVTTPAMVLFEVRDVSASTVASSPTTVSFDSATLGPSEVLRISVRADGDITMSGADPIPATSLSWTTSSAIGGAAMNGTLSKVSYTPVFQGQAGATSGSVDLTWTLAAIPTTVTAGTRQAVLRWKFEAITP